MDKADIGTVVGGTLAGAGSLALGWPAVAVIGSTVLGSYIGHNLVEYNSHRPMQYK